MFSGRQIECHYCYLDNNLSWCHISRWRRKSTTTILNLRSSACKRNKRYVQNWMYFRFVVVILKDWFAIDSNSIYLASVSSTPPKTYDYSFTSLTALFVEYLLIYWTNFRNLITVWKRFTSRWWICTIFSNLSRDVAMANK